MALMILEHGPQSIDDALAAWCQRYPATGNDGRREFNAAVTHLFTRGLIQVEEQGKLAITIAGRVALAD
ncbi:MAG: hypothetical protein IT436_13680, partial [Phycisphaerales bacterium]|nr:hypothetical protein [Phycisphaerales bacterium]